MMNAGNVPPVAAREQLARFVVQSSQFRQDRTVKPDLFIPNPKNQETSVMRHQDATEAEIWTIGRTVASSRTLHGRSDILANACEKAGLKVSATPMAANPNHADIHGWPENKPDQKAIAQKLAAEASRLIPPP